MKEFPGVKYVKRDNESELIEIEFSDDNVMNDPNSIFFLETRNRQVIEEISEGLKFPINITSIKLELVPSSMTKYLYSFNGLETIIFNLFKSEKKTFQDDLKKGDVYLKTYFRKDDFYTFPKLCLEIIFFRKLQNKTLDILWRKLESEILLFIGNVGDIDQEIIPSISIINDYLKIPLLVGQPEFTRDGVFKTNKFTSEQLIEMNYIHGISLIKLNMNEIINNKYLSLYDDIRECILSSNNHLEYNYMTEVDEVIKTMFTSEDKDNLPF